MPGRATRAFIVGLLTLPAAAGAQGTPLTVERIFASPELRAAPLPTIRWMKDGRSYLDIRPDPQGGTDLVKVDVASGEATVLADAASLIGAAGQRLVVEDVTLSPDESKALLFHSSVRVWRTNTRGVYHVLDFRSRRLTPIAPPQAGPRTSEPPPNPSFLARGLASGAADPDLQMFAKFSPDGRRVAFVRANDLWVTEIATGTCTRLTHDGSDDVVNGTSDWVHEEELGLRDAFRWSPDGKRIAYWRFDQRDVPAFPMVDETSLYPTVSVLRYPKAGEANARVTLGVVDATGGETRWLAAGPDTGVYFPRMDWLDRDTLVVTRLPRRQNRAELVFVSAASGQGRTIEVDSDSAYVGTGFTDVRGEGVRWLKDRKEFLWASDRSGWRQVYLLDREGRVVRQVTTDGADVLDLLAVDEGRDAIYVTLAAPDATQRQVYRFPLRGRRGAAGGVRVMAAPGSHALDVSRGGGYAVDVHSALGKPPTMTVYEFPDMRAVRTVVDNAALDSALASAGLRAPEFFRVPLPGVTVLDGYRIVPPGFDSTRKHPVLMYVYGGPAAPQVTHAWGGSRYLWHQMLAQQGYVVVVVDNRGAAWRGRAFRKGTQLQLGITESDDQIAVARWLGQQSWVDASRIGIWGWSYGGYLTTMSLVRGGRVFRMGIAVAPVTDWRLYDTIYTERYMWTPQGNAEGYRASSPQELVSGLTARLLLVHGTGDDNVHPQNTMQLADRLVAAGKPFDLMLYPNRTHSISGGSTSVHLFEKLTRYVLDNL
jgi:dipeptidyl-peptidase-4